MDRRDMREGEVRLDIRLNDTDVIIVIDEAISGVRIAEVRMTAEMWIEKTMMRIMNGPIDALITKHPELIGKKIVTDYIRFEIPRKLASLPREKRDAELKRLADEATPEGWYPDYYFASAGTITYKDDKTFCKCTVRGWFDPNEIPELPSNR